MRSSISQGAARRNWIRRAVSLIGDSVAAVQGDVSNLADLDRLYAKVASERGKIDVLFAGSSERSRRFLRTPNSPRAFLQ